MDHLDAGHESGRRPMLVGDQQVMARLGEKPQRRRLACVIVEEVVERQDGVLVSTGQFS